MGYCNVNPRGSSLSATICGSDAGATRGTQIVDDRARRPSISPTTRPVNTAPEARRFSMKASSTVRPIFAWSSS